MKANYLASPPLVVAYALAGTTDIDLTTEPIGQSDSDGQDVFLKDIWPTHEEVAEVVKSCVLPEMFQEQYGGVWDKNEKWNAIATSEGELYEWNEATAPTSRSRRSSWTLTTDEKPIEPITGARCLAVLGDSTRPTTSPRPARSPRTRPPASS